MAAVRPLVLVYQDFSSVSTPVALPDLNALVVGPCYDVLDYPVNKADISLGAFGSKTTAPNGSASAGVSVAAAVAGVRAGATVDSASLALYVDEALVEMAYGVDGVIVTDNNTFTTSGLTNFTNAGVTAGDRLVVTDIDSGGSVVTVDKTIMSVSANGQTLYTTTNFAKTGTDISGNSYTISSLTTSGLSYRIEKHVSGLTNSAGAGILDGNQVAPHVSATNIKLNVGGAAKSITYAKVYAAYRALRSDLSSDLDTVSTVDEIVGKLGVIDERNPLAVGVSVAFQNSNKAIQFVGVPTDDIAGYTAARDAIAGRKDVYAIVPMTQDTATIAMWKAHCRALSAPEISKFRIVIGSGSLPTTKTVYPASGTAACALEDEVPGVSFKLLDNAATFLSSGVTAGDLVTLGASDFVVMSVISENRLQLKGAKPVITTYRVYRKLTRDQQVTELAAVSASLKDARCTMVWPDKCYVAGISAVQPGYYVAAAVGGMVAGLPPHQGFTFLGLAGISQLVNSNTYFYDAQLTALSSAGWFVVVQDSPKALPYSIHELTTDTTTLETGELQVVKNFDYVSMTYRDVLVGFLGTYNITKDTLDFLRAALDGATSQLKSRKFPKIGAPISAATVTSLAQLPGSKDQVEAYLDVGLPRPLNRVGLHLKA